VQHTGIANSPLGGWLSLSLRADCLRQFFLGSLEVGELEVVAFPRFRKSMFYSRIDEFPHAVEFQKIFLYFVLGLPFAGSPILMHRPKDLMRICSFHLSGVFHFLLPFVLLTLSFLPPLRAQRHLNCFVKSQLRELVLLC